MSLLPKPSTTHLFSLPGQQILPFCQSLWNHCLDVLRCHCFLVSLGLVHVNHTHWKMVLKGIVLKCTGMWCHGVLPMLIWILESDCNNVTVRLENTTVSFYFWCSYGFSFIYYCKFFDFSEIWCIYREKRENYTCGKLMAAIAKIF